MAQKVNTKKQPEPKKHYVDPTKTWWGKAVVWMIIVGMVGLVILGLVVAIIEGGA